MTKHELGMYRVIAAELREIRQQTKSNAVTVKVSGSDSEFPYHKHNICVSSGTEIEDERNLMRERILENKKREIEDFINSISDLLMRRIFVYRYLNGKRKPSWQEIAFKIGHYDEQYPRKLHNKYLKQHGETNS